VSVVGTVKAEDSVSPGSLACDAEGEVVGFAAGVDQKANCQRFSAAWLRNGCEQALGIVDGVAVQVATVGVERRCLLAQRLDDSRVAVADVAYIVD